VTDGAGEGRVGVGRDADIVPARAEGRALALELGFSPTDATLITAAISELARNIIQHARRGEVVVRPESEGNDCGVAVVARDLGPGISTPEVAMEEDCGTGLGLVGASKVMDDFAVDTTAGGTTVIARKWRGAR